MRMGLSRLGFSAVAARRIFALVFALSAIGAGAQAAPVADDEVLRRLHRQWAKARVDGDVAFLERFYAPELTIHGMDGAVIPRASDIEAFAKRNIKPEIVEDEDVSVRIYGDTAVVTGIEHVRGTAYGRPGEFRLRFTNVLVRNRAGWQLVQHQSTVAR